ncbi:28S ribosomal protein S5 [Schistosoma japonicum]|uniref:Small ribosomal subunit protein uS5m n=1 Tax=Schistosoma japonicum TaxID=6182 RepID=A0A4Z2D779_SCHJA|nr:28S ribosomal protein S5, mitochondrial [Schistosoma japonicum]KAH8862801.1 28S ribosomal protein S5, mitochondrial [Schistosoma japonicum]KAH8862804.1 28S ribosomal protein S5, mitochondrial [Schistosoma japonicum]TNN12333.1 28S ribosomal protein S5 [Schistosoma japonicum]TNN12334.1 28S ribosomal protein S5 [Schistosoma japonicum]
MMGLRYLTSGILSKSLTAYSCKSRLFSADYRLSGLFTPVSCPPLAKLSTLLYNTHAFTPVIRVPCRYSTIFSDYPSGMLWEGVTGPKGGSKRRARGKRRVTRPKIDLHKGQKLGVGKASIIWPGLNADLSSTIKKGKYNEGYFKSLEAFRNKSAIKKKRAKLSPIERGWTGSRLGGQSVGPPTPNLTDFDCRVIESKVVATMTATKGRYRRFSVLVATGNGQGLCGIGKARALTLTSAVRRAKSRAAQNIMSFELKEGRTLWHVGHVCEWNSKIYASPLPEGAGLICHRMIRTLCNVIGIKDMYAKVEGSTTNYQAIARGFLRLLGQQKTYEELANSLGLHVVEFAADRNMYPHVLASPACGQTINLSVNAINESDPSCVMHSKSQKQSEDLPLLAISNPLRHKPRKPAPDEHDSFLDDLIDVDDDKTVAINITELLAAGERDLNTLMLGGRVPLKKNSSLQAGIADLTSPGRKTERHRYRNQRAVRLERNAHTALTGNPV